MPQHFKVHELLERKELDQLEEFSREPGRTVDQVHEWLQARGYTIGRTACWNWLAKFVSDDRMSRANDVARGLIAAATADKDAVSLSEAAMLKAGQMIFEKLLQMEISGDVDTKDLWRMSASIKKTLDSAGSASELRAKQKQALDEASKLADAGGDGAAVVEKVREILGIAA